MKQNITFFKFHGAGNDFILIDNLKYQISLTENQIKLLCHRRFGIGADGLIYIENSNNNTDFSMRYFNSDGREASLCGNGSRCIVAFANLLQLIDKQTIFSAFDGNHTAQIIHHHDNEWFISIQMSDIESITSYSDGYFVDTGSPHFVTFVKNTDEIDIQTDGRILRYDPRFENGTNVDFVMPTKEGLTIRTFERGVEDETYSCGTGVTASVIVWALHQAFANGNHTIDVNTKGGHFSVSFHKNNNFFSNIQLLGPVVYTFSGEIFV